MATQIQMLALSPTMEQGTIVKWLKKENETVAPQEVLCEVETDKATMDFESTDTGTLLKILIPEGQPARVGDPIAIIGQPNEDISSLLATKTEPAKPAEPTKPAPPTPAPKTETEPQKPEMLRSSPAARDLATKLGLDIATIPGSGPNGRITEKDVSMFSSQSRSQTKPSQIAAGDKVFPLTAIRRRIAQRLSDSKFSAPDYYVRLNVCADTLISARKTLNEQLGRKVSLNAFLIKFAALALAKHPDINSSWNADSIVHHSRIDIALAVQTDAGLLAPVVRDCLPKDIHTIDTALTDLIERSRTGKLTPADYENSTFTISNLGSLGIDEFTAIINPPNSAILAVGSIGRKLHITKDDQLTIRSEMKLTLTCDHRTIDGAAAAAFLTTLRDIIESPIAAMY